MPYPESVLHTFGRALASGQWRSRAVEAFQNAQRIALAKKEQGEASEHRQNVFDANEQWRQDVLRPTTLQNAQSRATQSDALRLNAQTRARDLTDELAGGKVNRGVLQAQASKAPLSEVPNLLSLDPSNLNTDPAVEAFKRAQDAQFKLKIDEHASKRSIDTKQANKLHAYKDTFSRLNEQTIGPKKEAGLPGGEFDRRQKITQRNMLLRQHAGVLAREGLSQEEIAKELEAYDQSLDAVFGADTRE